MIVNTFTDRTPFREARERSLDVLIEMFGEVEYKTNATVYMKTEAEIVQWKRLLAEVEALVGENNRKIDAIVEYEWEQARFLCVGAFDVITGISKEVTYSKSELRFFTIADIRDELLAVQFKLSAA